MNIEQNTSIDLDRDQTIATDYGGMDQKHHHVFKS